MSDRFYSEMIQSVGWAPGYRNTFSFDQFEQTFGKQEKTKNGLDR